MKQYEIKSLPWEFIITAAMGALYFAIGLVFFYRSGKLWGILISVIALRAFFYGSVDFLFRKIIIENEAGLYIRVFYTDLPLDKTRSYIVVAPQSILTQGRQKSYNLLLVRNDKRYIKRLFKNRSNYTPKVLT